jgi:hypothetical protein
VTVYVPATVTKAIVLVIALHILLGILSPSTLAVMLAKYSAVIQLLIDYLPEPLRSFIMRLLGF